MVDHVRGQKADAVPPTPARRAEAAADPTHPEAIGVDLHPETLAEMLADYLVHPTNLRKKSLLPQPLGEQLAPQ